jgi:hypothetical protein
MTDQECHVDEFGRSEGGRGSAVEVLAHAVFRCELPCQVVCERLVSAYCLWWLPSG